MRWVPATARGRALLAAGVAGGLVVAVAGGLGIARLADAAHLRAAPGGVTTLAAELTQVWSVPVDGALDARLVRMPGTVAVVARDRVLGLDPATGEERWPAVVLEGGGTCGPLPAVRSEAVAPLERLVCLTGAEGREVVVVEADGTTRRSELDPGVTAAPAPDGALWIVERVGDTPDAEAARAALTEVTDAAGAVTGLSGVAEGPDLRVRLQDAATGEVRWTRDLPSRPVEVSAAAGAACVTWQDGTPRLVLDAPPTVVATPTALAAGGCGVAQVFTPDGDAVEPSGTLLGDGASPALQLYSDGGLDFVQHGLGSLPGTRYPLPGGGYLRADGELVSLDGDRVRLDGAYLDPFTTDGTTELRLVARDDALMAVRGDGTEVWTADVPAAGVLVRTRDVAVVVGPDGVPHGLDPATGEALWVGDRDVVPAGTAVENVVFAAFTDGETVLIAVGGAEGRDAGLRLVALDLSTGSVRWEVAQETPYTQLLGVDGHLVQVTEQGVAGLG